MYLRRRNVYVWVHGRVDMKALVFASNNNNTQRKCILYEKIYIYFYLMETGDHILGNP